MSRCLLLLLSIAVLLAPPAARADELTREVQEALKRQGFYYGEVDGLTGSETVAAIRRYQIRNGLEVTGRLNNETLRSLRGEESPAVADTPAARPPAVAYRESDQEFLEEQRPSAASRAPAAPSEPPPPAPPEPSSRDSRFGYLPPPAPLPPAHATRDLDNLFRGTRFEGAPLELQEDVLRDAQVMLARRGYYRGSIDGIPGPATERAIVVFQDDSGLRRTARLDESTLAELDLISSRRRIERRFEIQIWPRSPQRRVYRGRWVD